MNSKELLGETIMLAGQPSKVTEWRQKHPMQTAKDNGLFAPMTMEDDPDGWFKVCLEANPGSELWWRYAVLRHTMDKPVTRDAGFYQKDAA